jgi:hypothetical protein
MPLHVLTKDCLKHGRNIPCRKVLIFQIFYIFFLLPSVTSIHEAVGVAVCGVEVVEVAVGVVGVVDVAEFVVVVVVVGVVKVVEVVGVVVVVVVVGGITSLINLQFPHDGFAFFCCSGVLLTQQMYLGYNESPYQRISSAPFALHSLAQYWFIQSAVYVNLKPEKIFNKIR